MNKTLTLAALLLLGLATLTSCDEDREEARILSGEWTGNFGMYYYDALTDITHWASYTDIRFIPNGSYSRRGTGEEIDYFSWPCPVRYQSFYFRWEIRNGVIYLDYPYNADLNVSIYDYRLDYDYFSGYFGDSNEYFRLVKLSGYYDWNLYDNRTWYGYGYYDPYYYAKGREGVADSEQQPLTDPKYFRFGRSLRQNSGEE